MDSLGGVQLIKADGSSHAAEAALDGKVGCIEERPNTAETQKVKAFRLAEFHAQNLSGRSA